MEERSIGARIWRITRYIHHVQRRWFQDELDVLGSDTKIFRYMNGEELHGHQVECFKCLWIWKEDFKVPGY